MKVLLVVAVVREYRKIVTPVDRDGLALTALHGTNEIKATIIWSKEHKDTLQDTVENVRGLASFQFYPWSSTSLSGVEAPRSVKTLLIAVAS